jgi:hypothetical protein
MHLPTMVMMGAYLRQLQSWLVRVSCSQKFSKGNTNGKGKIWCDYIFDQAAQNIVSLYNF